MHLYRKINGNIYGFTGKKMTAGFLDNSVRVAFQINVIQKYESSVRQDLVLHRNDSESVWRGKINLSFKTVNLCSAVYANDL